MVTVAARTQNMVGVVISEHCATHNFGVDDATQTDIFDRPERVAQLLHALQQPAVPAAAHARAQLQQAIECMASSEQTPSPVQTSAAGAVAAVVMQPGETVGPVMLSTRRATDAELTLAGVTSRRYLAYLQQQSRAMQKRQAVTDKWSTNADGGMREWEYLDADNTTLVTAGAEVAARSGVGACLDGAEHVLRGRWCHAFVCGRPPGHHNGCCELLEQLDHGGHKYACHGGCTLNETAVAIRHVQRLAGGASCSANRAEACPRRPPARKKGRLTRAQKIKPNRLDPAGGLAGPSAVYRVAVVDVDIHFGDGTALQFYDDPSVLHISMHLDQSDQRLFPFLVGKAEERGMEAGLGTTVNLPLPEGAGDDVAWRLFVACGLQRLRDFAPAMIFLSCGFDGLAGDPTMANTNFTPAWYGRMAAACASISPVVATLQGGYLAEGVAQAGVAVIAGLSGRIAYDTPSAFESPSADESASALASELVSELVSCSDNEAVQELLVEMASSGAGALVRSVERRLEDAAGWWEVEQSFNHGLHGE